MINIYGKGDHSRVVSSAIRHPKKIMFWDDKDFRLQPEPWVIAIGDNKARKRIAEKVLCDIEYATVISDSAVLYDAHIGHGSQILQRSVVQIGTKIGKHCMINTAASVDNDCILDDFTFIGPNATLCGGVKIGEGSFIGAGAVILPYVKIGKNCMIGAGSVVTKDIPNDSTAYGNPAKIK